MMGGQFSSVDVSHHHHDSDIEEGILQTADDIEDFVIRRSEKQSESSTCTVGDDFLFSSSNNSSDVVAEPFTEIIRDIQRGRSADIPDNMRGALWSYLIGNSLKLDSRTYDTYKVSEQQLRTYAANLLPPATMSIKSIFSNSDKRSHHRNASECCKGLKQYKTICKELQRMNAYQTHQDMTHSDNQHQMSPKHRHVASVLMAFCNLNPRISFAQFMIYISDFLLHFQTPQIAFISFCNLLQHPIFDTVLHLDGDKLEKQRVVLMTVLQLNASRLCDYLSALCARSHSHILDGFILECMQSLFTTQLRKECVVKVWDAFLVNGTPVLWQCAASILITLDWHLRIVDQRMDANGVGQVLQSVDKWMTDKLCRTVINTMASITVPDSIKCPSSV